MNSVNPILPFMPFEKEVLLEEGDSQITINGRTYSSKATAYLQLALQTSIRFKTSFSEIASDDLQDILNSKSEKISFSFEGKDIPGFLSRTHCKLFEQTCEIIWQPQSEGSLIFGSDKAKLKHVDFHLLNITNPEPFIGTTDWDGWQISFNRTKFGNDDVAKLKESGGFLLTHMARLIKKDGRTFTAGQGQKILSQLNWAMSFALGRPTSCICPAGYDAKNKIVWQQWNSPASGWYSVINWLPNQEFHAFHKFLPDFLTLTSSTTNWEECLKEILYWYGRANNSKYVGVDAALILTQTAIERLSYEYIVLHKKMLSYEGFKDLRASDKFRMLFSLLNIPIDIPANFKTIKSINTNWKDSAHALTDIRNSLVHPEHKSRSKYAKAYVEGWNLSMWYLELCLLSLSKYQGKYNNRSKPHNGYPLEDVPWV